MDQVRRRFTRNALLTGVFSPALAGSLFAASDSVHVVQAGDTLTGISKRYGISTSELRRANKVSGDLIRVGQRLSIPGTGSSKPAPPSYHIVQAGDTLSGIAIQYGITVAQIKRDNSLNSDVIRIGQKLVISSNHTSGNDYLVNVRAVTARISVRRDNWKRIVVHHSGIKHGNASVYDSAHRRRGMQNGLAYHFVIGNGIDSGDGEIEIGPRWRKQLLGGHVKSYHINLTAIGICLVGNFEKTHPSRRQLEAFTQLMDWLRGGVLPKAHRFAGHRELKGEQTICPGKNFPLAAMHARYGH
ncbi:peptidoglycan-binding protein [Coraliomargarita sinensis]|uniref:Peptidoglycan-binding protein n=1 Tax=Coraliomargarita sinensis TaxID=2174842 RepID=A0A317ZJ24_9BACT|nr:LysM peptidoglycan-binding domain-containing protein [Coraliomargarita sinensis]PXA03779.1 peptidoglycan-binding protein [Coraliomargarita sinensis]